MHGWMFHFLSQWVAQNIIRTSPLQSLQNSTPKPYRVWYHLNLQTQLQIQMSFRGLSAKLHYMHFEIGSNVQTTITMQLLGRNYTKIIYGMAIFEFGTHLTKTKEMEGLFAKLPYSNYLEGQSAKSPSPWWSVSQDTPKTYMGCPWMNWKFKLDLNLNSISNLN